MTKSFNFTAFSSSRAFKKSSAKDLIQREQVKLYRTVAMDRLEKMLAQTERKLRMHAQKFVALSPSSSLQQIQKFGNTAYFLPRALKL